MKQRTSSNTPAEFVKFKNLTRSNRDLDGTFQQMGKLLEKCHLKAKLQFRIIDGEEAQYFSLDVSNNNSKVQNKAVEKFDFEVITTEDTWWQIASGTLAPLQALGNGQLRFRGDIAIGQRVMRHLAGAGSVVEIC